MLVDQRPDPTVSRPTPNERRRRTNRYQINLWSLPEPGPQPDICLSGSCRRDICPRDIYRPAQPPAEAEAVGGRQQLLFPRKLEQRSRGSRISTSKSPTVNRGSLEFTNRQIIWRSPRQHQIDKGISGRPSRVLSDVAKMARNLRRLDPGRFAVLQIQDLSGPTSEYRREDVASPRHIRAIAVAKGL